MSESVIRVENLSKRYRIGAAQRRPQSGRQALAQALRAPFRYLGTVFTPPTEAETLWALRNVSFEVKRGEVVGIIGRNGAGKSTLLKILSRITEPTGGRAELRGRVGSLLEVGIGFHPELTGRENIFLNGAIMGMKKREIERKFDEIVDFAEVEKFIDTPVKHYSSGMYVRLAFAVAAHFDSEILIVDEVLAVGDVAFQKKCLNRMESVAGGGQTILFVSHNMNAIRHLCARTVLIRDGRVEQDGKTDSVIAAYTAEFVRQTAEYAQPEDKSKRMHIRHVRLMDSQGALKTEFEQREDMTLAIEYEVNAPALTCVVWTAVRTASDLEVLVTADYDKDPSLLGERKPGCYEAVVRIPGGWLNTGAYCVVAGISGYVPVACSYDRVDAIHFSVRDSTEHPISEGATRASVLIPQLEWRTQRLER